MINETMIFVLTLGVVRIVQSIIKNSNKKRKQY